MKWILFLTLFFSLTLFAKTKNNSTVASPTTADAKYTPDYIQGQIPILDHGFYDYLRRLGISEQEVVSSKGKKWLSVGEGKSNFVAETAKRGVDSQALDAVIKNPFAPQRSHIGLSQKLPFPDGQFDRVVSVWLVDHFFDPKTFNDPEGGKQTLKEMIRVTKILGDIRINPVRQGAIFPLLDEWKKNGVIHYEVLPYFKGEFHLEGKTRIFDLTPVAGKEPGSIKITRLK